MSDNKDAARSALMYHKVGMRDAVAGLMGEIRTSGVMPALIRECELYRANFPEETNIHVEWFLKEHHAC